MKRFGDFFSEARTSQASEKAKKLGLKGDGHGGWYDRSGEFIAKTEKGDLKFFTKGQKPGKDVPNPKQRRNLHLHQRLKQRLLLLQVNKLQQQIQKQRKQREVVKKRRKNVDLIR